MKNKFYASKPLETILKVTTELGKDYIQIGVCNSKLEWHSITLDVEQSKAFKRFMRENDV